MIGQHDGLGGFAAEPVDSSNQFQVRPIGDRVAVSAANGMTILYRRSEAINLAAWLTVITNSADAIARQVEAIKK